MGYYFSLRMLEAGHKVTVLNRGLSPDDLPKTVHRLRADRTDPQQLRRALMAKSFDVVVDFVMHRGHEADVAIELLKDNTDHYIFISSGQVYLVREGAERPFSEDDYDGRLQPPPKAQTYAYEEWQYGMNKREVEDRLQQAHTGYNFPYTSLRLPMVNSERDPFKRLYSYIIRLRDGDPLLIPETPTFPLRHVYGQDVVDALEILVETGKGKGRAYNISQDETVTIDEFLGMLNDIMGTHAPIIRVKRSLLEANGFLPDCSPFSERWMSELTNERSKAELDMTYTPLRDYLTKLVDHYDTHRPATPVGYKRRNAEAQTAKNLLKSQE